MKIMMVIYHSLCDVIFSTLQKPLQKQKPYAEWNGENVVDILFII